MTPNGMATQTYLPQWVAALIAAVLMNPLSCTAADAPVHRLDGVVMISPNCAGAQAEGKPCKGPMSGAEVRLTGVDGRAAASTTTDAAGAFRMLAPAGRYRLHVVLGPAKVPRCPVLDVTLPLAKGGAVELECDSGMR